MSKKFGNFKKVWEKFGNLEKEIGKLNTPTGASTNPKNFNLNKNLNMVIMLEHESDLY